jgi:signal transduction histidine kinase
VSDAKHTVLVVDDERQTVVAVKHLLRRRYNVLGATRGDEALAMMAQEPVSVVLCDQRMPGMTGDRFLEQVRKQYPDTVRILITAYADLQALIRSVNEGQIFAYVAKPWGPEELERVVDQAVGWRQLVEDNRRMTRELEVANGNLQRMVGELRQFTHVVAHDLKEPLRTISAYAQFLRDDFGAERPEALQYVDGISRCARNLRQLIDDLLRISELDHQESLVRPVALNDVARRALEALDGAVAEAAAQVHVAPDLPVVRGDSQRLTLLFQNLLSNALKFNDKPQKRVEMVAVPAPAGQARVAVIDNGIGIPAEQRTEIFRIFHRLHTKVDFPGTGAGLAIVRKIAESHGGTVEVDSVEGQGSRFVVTLPAAT